jgi:hypothetical protein
MEDSADWLLFTAATLCPGAQRGDSLSSRHAACVPAERFQDRAAQLHAILTWHVADFGGRDDKARIVEGRNCLRRTILLWSVMKRNSGRKSRSA